MDPVKVGTRPPADAKRDAIHIAVYPIVAGEVLEPGYSVKIVDGKAYASDEKTRIGIVDPFIRWRNVRAGEAFYLFLDPNTIVGLRHEWFHPQIPPDGVSAEDEDKLAATATIAQYAQRMGMDVARLLAAADMFQYDEYTMDNTERYKDLDWHDFWPAYEKVRGKKVDDIKEGYAPFTCSC